MVRMDKGFQKRIGTPNGLMAELWAAKDLRVEVIYLKFEVQRTIILIVNNDTVLISLILDCKKIILSSRNLKLDIYFIK